MLSRRIIILLAIPLVSVFSHAQIELSPDTIYYGSNTGGSIDTFDISNADLPTTFDGGRSVYSRSGMSTMRLFEDLIQRPFQHYQNFDKLSYSGLPHLGFAYSFGGQGSQFLRLNYAQYFDKGYLLNFKYNRNTGAGFISNSNFTNDEVQLRLQKTGQRYSFQLEGAYLSNNIAHPGGVLSGMDTIIDIYGLEFASVFKSNAESSVKVGKVDFKHYLNFTNDSLNHFGLVIHNNYSIVNRVYLESDTLNGIYTNTFVDTANTLDQWNHPSISNGAGVYYSNRRSQLYLDWIIGHTYWWMRDLKELHDTNEIYFESNQRLVINRLFTVNNSLKMNLVGRFNEWSENAQLVYQGNKIKATGGLHLSNNAPEPYLRSYFSNNYDYSLSSFDKDLRMRVGAGIEINVIDSILAMKTYGDFSTISSWYSFDGGEWRNDQLNQMSFASIGVDAKLHLGQFHLYPTVKYTIDENNYLPGLQGYLRAMLKTRLFKAKKLELALGVDASYISQFKPRVYMPAINAYDWYAMTNENGAIANLHAFASFGIEEFRFYVRFENIGYFWSEISTNEVLNYPLSGTRLRVGLTWDFFN